MLAASIGVQYWRPVLAASTGGQYWRPVLAASTGGQYWPPVLAPRAGSQPPVFGGQDWQPVLAASIVTNTTFVDPSEGALEAAVSQQPVSVTIEGDKPVFQHYTSGVLTNEGCGSQLDHAVLAVGFGTDNGQKYWILKNSWGTSFGEEGYIRIERGAAEDGGELRISTAQHEATRDIWPESGRLVIFDSKQVWHEVLPCFRERSCVVGWFRST